MTPYKCQNVSATLCSGATIYRGPDCQNAGILFLNMRLWNNKIAGMELQNCGFYAGMLKKTISLYKIPVMPNSIEIFFKENYVLKGTTGFIRSSFKSGAFHV